MTMTMHMDGAFAGPDVMAKMPPQARAAMQAAMDRMQQPTTHTSCLTPEKLAKGFDVTRHLGSNCQPALLQQTSSLIEVRATCESRGGGTTVEHGTITAVDGQTLAGNFDIQRTAAQGPKHMTLQFTGKFVGATCTGKEDDAP